MFGLPLTRSLAVLTLVVALPCRAQTLGATYTGFPAGTLPFGQMDWASPTSQGTARLLQRMTPLAVSGSSSYAYVRTPWDGTRDLVQRLTYNFTTTQNDPTEAEGTRLIPIGTANASISTAWSSSTDVVSSHGDDADPPIINGIRYGGNHGPEVGINVTVASHDKTAVDVGSRWQDAGAKAWTLVRIIDATHLYFMPENTGTATAWAFVTSVTGTSMTHVSGATHTATVNFSGSALYQYENIFQNQTKTMYCDGVVKNPGVFTCRVFELVDVYDLPNLASGLAYVQANVGSAVAKTLNDPAVQSQVKMVSRHRITPDGGYTIRRSITALQDFTMPSGYFGFSQGGMLKLTAATLKWYAPRVTNWTGLRTYTPTSTDDITTLPGENLTLTSARWADAANPPDRIAMFSGNAGVTLYGFMIGIHRLIGVGITGTRVGLVSQAGYLSTAGKMYPYVVDSANVSSVAAGTTFDGLMYRCYWTASHLTTATTFCTYMVGSQPFVVLDFHQNVTGQVVQLPVAWAGAVPAVVDQSAGFALNSTSVSATGQISVTVTGGYGYGILRLQ